MGRAMLTVQEWVTLYGLRIVGAFAILCVGRWASGALRKVFRRLIANRMVDPTLATFGGNVVYLATMIFVVVAALSQLGVETTSVIAVLGTASLAVGLALQGSLANFAAGLLILVLRPFKVGDTIAAAGVTGVVEELQFLTTQLRAPDNRVVLVPNSKLTGDSIVNFSVKESLRADFLFTVGVQHDAAHVRGAVLALLGEDARVLRDPPPEVFLSQCFEGGLRFVVRPWVANADHARFTAEALENLKAGLESRGVAVVAARR